MERTETQVVPTPMPPATPCSEDAQCSATDSFYISGGGIGVIACSACTRTPQCINGPFHRQCGCGLPVSSMERTETQVVPTPAPPATPCSEDAQCSATDSFCISGGASGVIACSACTRTPQCINGPFHRECGCGRPALRSSLRGATAADVATSVR